MGFGTRETPEDRDVGHLTGQSGLGEHSVKVGSVGPGERAGPKVLLLQGAFDRGHWPAALQLPKAQVEWIWEGCQAAPSRQAGGLSPRNPSRMGELRAGWGCCITLSRHVARDLEISLPKFSDRATGVKCNGAGGGQIVKGYWREPGCPAPSKWGDKYGGCPPGTKYAHSNRDGS